MTPNVRRFVKVTIQNINPDGPVVEIGSFIVKGHEKLANLRSFFPQLKYIGCDIRKGPGVDRIENVEKLTFKNGKIGTVLILETLEHVQNPIKAMSEIHRVLKKDGIAIVSSLMNFRIHNYPEDYWRFTPRGIEYLLRKFPLRIIGFQGEKEEFPTNIFGIGFKSNDKEKANHVLKVLRENAIAIKGRKPWRHRLFTSRDYFKEAVSELTHEYYLKYYLTEGNKSTRKA